jgi:hypothetical protein
MRLIPVKKNAKRGDGVLFQVKRRGRVEGEKKEKRIIPSKPVGIEPTAGVEPAAFRLN